MTDDHYEWKVTRLRINPYRQRERDDEDAEEEENRPPKEKPRYRIRFGKRVRLKKGEYAGPPPNIVPLFSGVKPELERKPGKSRADDRAEHVKKPRRRAGVGKRAKRSGDR
jgi:hypothetical protein